MVQGLSEQPVRLRVLFPMVVAGGVFTIGASIVELAQQPFRSEWLVLTILTLFTGSFSIKLPSISARFSVSEAFVFAAVLLFGPAVATVVVALDTVILTTSQRQRQRRSAVRAVFNVSAGAMAIWIAAHLYELLLPSESVALRLEQLLLPVLVLAASYFGINSSLIAIAIATEKRMSPVEVWQRNFAWLSLNYLGGASVAMLLATYRRELDFTTLSVIIPLLVISYLTFRTSSGRLEDAQQHVAQVNDLYLSTIEALAMAVDAKDQITHGHIRRVQVYAVELAKRLGVDEEQQLKALEAAALLHDMGKLAIPEHILNKPGQLTPVEFEKMKRHADIGADLLSSIKFPYPVVPIVRHHHENWDGTGYPARISGTDIPLGARILSVVDCFDALTSDRPYRPRLTVEDAFRVLRERRGAMYDPLVVDTFVAAYGDIAPAANLAGQQARTLVPTLHESDSNAPALRNISENAAQASRLTQFAYDLERSRTIHDAMLIVNQYVRLLTPASVCALYRYASDTDFLTCCESSPEAEHLLLGLTIKRGERITGWVAANDNIIANSDATLDLSQIAGRFNPEVKSAIAAPLHMRGALFGVLTAYAARKEPFTNDDKYAFERIAAALSGRLTNLIVHSERTTLVRFPSQERG